MVRRRKRSSRKPRRSSRHGSTRKTRPTARYGYHGTNARHLPSIANAGLLPFESSTGPGVFFVDNPAEAARFGVVLRFPWPARAHARDRYYAAPDPVPADGIEALVDGRWVPISTFYDPDV